MKRIVLGALMLSILYAVPATAGAPTVDLTAAFPSAPGPLLPQVVRREGRVVIVDGARVVPLKHSRIVRVGRLQDGSVQRLSDGYLVEAVTSGDSETNAGDFIVVDAHGRVTRFLLHGGPAKDADTEITPAVSRDGTLIAWVDGPINQSLVRTRNRLNVFSVPENRLVHVRTFSTGGLYAMGVSRRKVLWASHTRLYTWTFRSGRISSIAAAFTRSPYLAPSPAEVSANLSAAIVEDGHGCQAVLDLATGQTSDSTCSQALGPISANGHLVIATDHETRGSNGIGSGPRHAWLRDRSGTDLVAYDVGAGNSLFAESFIAGSTVLLATDVYGADGVDTSRTLACTLAACEVVPAA